MPSCAPVFFIYTWAPLHQRLLNVHSAARCASRAGASRPRPTRSPSAACCPPAGLCGCRMRAPHADAMHDLRTSPAFSAIVELRCCLPPRVDASHAKGGCALERPSAIHPTVLGQQLQRRFRAENVLPLWDTCFWLLRQVDRPAGEHRCLYSSRGRHSGTMHISCN